MKMILKLICGLAVLVVFVNPAWTAGDQKFQVTTLSSRPDMITGGDVLLQIDVPATVAPDKVIIKLNGEAVTSNFQPDAATHTMTGLVKGLKIGENKVEVFVSSAGKPVAQVTLKNYAITGPVFSGPQEQPFVCQTQEFRMLDKSSLGAPLDANCSVKTIVSYVYKSTESAPPAAQGGRGGGNGNFPGVPVLNVKPLTDLTTLPADVAYTTTTTGDKVPFVVRVETGTINRGIYQIVVLSDPTKESQIGPLNPPKEWNKRLMYSFGPGCPGGWLKQGANLGVGSMVSEAVVGKGYAEASSTLNVFGNNCNDVLAAETMMMVKERFIKAYGKPEFTMSRGGSGGSEQQVPIAENYPGLIDGIIPSLTFPDVMANAQAIIDTQLLNGYYAKAGDALSRDQKLAITGAADLKDFAADVGRISPTVNCPKQLKSELYDPTSNRTGARCDVFDHAVNVYGRDPSTGFARRPVDNSGVQYGLAALNAGKITPAQFLDLNEKIGGYDNDGNPMPARSVADPTALRIAYQTGRVVNGGLGLGKLPIIDVRPYRDSIPGGDVHQKFHSFSLRDRLRRANGTIANDVMVVGPISATEAMGDYAMMKMDEWLTNLEKDTSNKPMIDKIVSAKPADLVDGCQTSTGERIIEPQTPTGGKCNELYPTFQSPRMVAGDTAGNDILKCQMKPISARDYQVAFSDSEKARLASIFPNGVCDWSKPGVEQKAPTRTWITYSDAGDQGKLAHPGNLTAGR